MITPRMKTGLIVARTARGLSAHANNRRTDRAADASMELAFAPWTYQAACQGMDPELFFGREGESRRELNRREAAAKAVCARCPVAAVCRQWAVDHNERGIWGGTSRTDRVGRRKVATGSSGMPRKRPVRPAEARTAPSAPPGPPAPPVRVATARSGAAGSGAGI